MINMGWDSAGSLLAMMATHVHDDYYGLDMYVPSGHDGCPHVMRTCGNIGTGARDLLPPMGSSTTQREGPPRVYSTFIIFHCENIKCKNKNGAQGGWGY